MEISVIATREKKKDKKQCWLAAYSMKNTKPPSALLPASFSISNSCVLGISRLCILTQIQCFDVRAYGHLAALLFNRWMRKETFDTSTAITTFPLYAAMIIAHSGYCP